MTPPAGAAGPPPPRPAATPVRGWEEPLPGGAPADAWLEALHGILGDGRGLLLLERPGADGAPEAFLAWDPAPISPLAWTPPPLEGPAPAAFFGGWAGVIAYDLGREFERLPAIAADEGWPAWAGGVHPAAVVIDRGGARARLCGHGDPAAAEAMRRVAREAARAAAARPRPAGSGGAALRGGLRSNLSRPEHEARVARAVEFVRAGDIFQVNLARRVEGRLAIPPVELARRLRASNPAPRSCVADLGGGRWVISSSPEMLLEVEGDRAVTRPIKGTRRRTGDAAADARAVADLLGSAKEAAELAMIVDLERNDLGRVAAWGGVRVAEPRRLEAYATVFHTEAVVEARLRPGVGPADLLRAVFPGGSVTGAPKIRAMEIIEELEPVRRGAYTGSAFGFAPGGGAQGNILIRTLCVDGERVHFSVGGGITAESEPAAEYEETVAKGVALARALGAAGA